MSDPAEHNVAALRAVTERLEKANREARQLKRQREQMAIELLNSDLGSVTGRAEEVVLDYLVEAVRGAVGVPTVVLRSWCDEKDRLGRRTGALLAPDRVVAALDRMVVASRKAHEDRKGSRPRE